MFATISSIISVIGQLIALFKMLLSWVDQQKVVAAEKRRVALEQALADAVNAKTPEEAWDAQERINANQP